MADTIEVVMKGMLALMSPLRALPESGTVVGANAAARGKPVDGDLKKNLLGQAQ